MFRSYEPDADRALDDERDAPLSWDDYRSAFFYADKEGWGYQWLEDHVDRKSFPPDLKQVYARMRAQQEKETVIR